MTSVLHFAVTLICCFAGGMLFKKLKVPGYMLLGAVITAAALNIAFDAAYMPLTAKLAAQVIAGAFIGSTIERSDLMRIKNVAKEAVILICGYLLMNITMGLLIYLVSPLDLMTALFCTVPGGMNDTPLIAAEMGADASKVVVLQFARMMMGIGVFPGMIAFICRNEERQEIIEEAPVRVVAEQVKTLPIFFITMGTAAVFGIIGYILGIPAGALVFSIIGMMILKLLWNKYYLPPWIKRLAQLLSGAYIGSSIQMQSVIELRYLVLPVVIVIVGYALYCFLGGRILQRFCGMSRKEGMLACTPAGASDMALLSMDMGVQSSDLVVLHVIRLLTVSTIFPQVVRLIATYLPI